MYARVSRYNVPVAKLEGDIAGVEDTQRRVQEMPGSLGLYYLVDETSGTTMAITLWESEQAMWDSEAAASALRDETTRANEGEIVSVEHFEVVAQPSRVPATMA